MTPLFLIKISEHVGAVSGFNPGQLEGLIGEHEVSRA